MEHKIDTDPLLCLSSRRDSQGTDMGQYPKSTSQVMTKVGDIPVQTSKS